MPKFVTKNTLFKYFWAGIIKNCCHIWSQLFGFISLQSFLQKLKISKFETKNALQIYPNFGQQFGTTIVIFEVCTNVGAK